MNQSQIMRAMAAALLCLLASCTQSQQGGYGQAKATPAPDTQPATPPATASVPAVPKGGFATAIASAVRTNPDLGRATADLRSAEARARATKGAFLPTISLGLDAKSRSARSAAAAPITPYLRVSQLVYDGGASTNRRSAAQARVAESRGSRVETAAAAALAAVERYSAVLTGRALLGLANDNLAAHETLLAQIEQRVSTGAGVTSDRLSAQARLAEARSLQISRLAGLERAQADYRQAFGTQAGALPQPSPAPALAGTMAQIIAASPRVQASNARIQAALADLAAARAQRWPSVIAGLGGQRLADGSTDVALDMSLNYSLDTAGQRRAAIEVAQANVASLTLEKDALEREIRRALDFVRSDQAAGRARIAAARAAVQANARTVAAAGEEFTIGRRSLLDLLDAQRDFVLAQQTLIEAEEQLLLSGYAALALTGDILPAFGVALKDDL